MAAQVSGLIVPLPEPVIDRIFHHHDIYAQMEPGPESLKVGSRLFFFDTKDSKALIGEAVIARIAMEELERVKQYGDRLFLSPDEFDQSSHNHGMTPKARVLVMEVRDAVKYVTPVKCPVTIPSTGLEMTSELHQKIVTANR